MTKFWKSLTVASAALSVVTVAGAAQAAPDSAIIDQINSYGQEGQANTAGQVNSVFQLRDVSPSDWAFDALRNLVEKYNCIVGYPDGTFRGNRPLSRYEFAAGLNACLSRIEAGDESVDPAELAQIRAMVQEFEAELATLGARVDDLEGRVGFLEDHQFSTTTKLSGEVIFGLTDSFGDSSATDGVDDDFSQTTFSDRVRLTLSTSFTGKDTLITRLAAGNAPTFAPDGGVGVQTYDNGSGNSVSVDWLAYYFPIKKANAYLAASGGLHGDYVSTTFGAAGLEDYTGGSGSLTFNAASSPIYMIGGGTGLGLNFPVGPVDLSLGYLANDAADSSTGNGLFNGEYAALAQIAFNIGSKASLGLTYVNSYQQESLFNLGGNGTLAGTSFANFVNGAPATEASTFGLQGKFDLTEKVSLAAYGLYSDVGVDGLNNDGEVWSYGIGASLSDVGKEGNVLGLFAGVPPYLGGTGEDPLQVEAFYKYQLNDSISITPGVIWLNDAAQGTGNEGDAVIGTVRTTFKF